METIPDSHKDLLERPVVVSLATKFPGGPVQVQPVWCGFDGSCITINTAIGRTKDKNMRANRDVTVLAVDPDNVFRWLEVRGKVAEITTKGADTNIDDLSEQYLGTRPYPMHDPEVTRVIFRIEPTRVVAFPDSSSAAC